MNLVITVHVKFRAFRMDFGKVDREFRFPVPPEALLFAGLVRDELSVTERGVSITARLEAGL